VLECSFFEFLEFLQLWQLFLNPDLSTWMSSCPVILLWEGGLVIACCAPGPIWKQRLEEKFLAAAGGRTLVIKFVVRQYPD
jgi:hypothetical protein